MGTASAAEPPDYRGMVERIGVLLDGTAVVYRAGDAETAKANVQRAYFEIFENLEGPIRVNVSAARNIALEAAFGEIRRMIVHGDPPDAVAARIATQMAELRAVLPELEGGTHLVAESSHPAEEAVAAPRVMQPHWARVVDGIAAGLETAAAAYDSGRTDEARAQILRTQYDGYKNSLLETAVRRHVSQRQDAEYNGEFVRIAELARDGKPAPMLRASIAALVEDLRRTLLGVPLVDGVTVAAEAEAPVRDWRAVRGEVAAGIAKSLALHAEGKTLQAQSLVQETYFDVFEASGMEARIGARDAAFKTALEGHFSRLVALMKAGALAADLEAARAAMAADFDRAVAQLQDGGQSPTALFLYSLLIIAREGVEALLIVASIVAYLAKTGNGDKLGVITNSVVVAVAASVATAILLKGLLNATAAGQEVMEGATMLLAALILFSMSYWLVSKAEAQRWMAYIKGRMDQSLSTGSLRVLWFTSFLAVYREGAETVLFYQALSLEADGTAGVLAIAGGFAAGCALLAVLFVVVRQGAAKLPIRPFFLVTGGLLYALAFVFAGKGMMELVEGKILEPTLLAGFPELPLLGVFPYWQTLAPQAALVLAAAGGTLLLLRRAPAR
ncbi:FTR1 family iron permease [Azospirillum doebereinerae]